MAFAPALISSKIFDCFFSHLVAILIKPDLLFSQALCDSHICPLGLYENICGAARMVVYFYILVNSLFFFMASPLIKLLFYNTLLALSNYHISQTTNAQNGRHIVNPILRPRKAFIIPPLPLLDNFRLFVSPAL